MAVEVAVVVRRIEQALAAGSAIGIVEDGEAREMNRSAANELDARTRDGFAEARALDVVADRTEDAAKRRLFAGTNRGENGQGSRRHSVRRSRPLK